MFSDGVELKSYIVDISIIYESFPSTSILTNIYWISIFADLFLTVQEGGPRTLGQGRHSACGRRPNQAPTPIAISVGAA